MQMFINLQSFQKRTTSFSIIRPSASTYKKDCFSDVETCRATRPDSVYMHIGRDVVMFVANCSPYTSQNRNSAMTSNIVLTQ